MVNQLNLESRFSEKRIARTKNRALRGGFVFAIEKNVSVCQYLADCLIIIKISCLINYLLLIDTVVKFPVLSSINRMFITALNKRNLFVIIPTLIFYTLDVVCLGTRLLIGCFFFNLKNARLYADSSYVSSVGSVWLWWWGIPV